MKKIGNFFIQHSSTICCWLCGLGSILNAYVGDIPLTITWGFCATAWLAIATSKE